MLEKTLFRRTILLLSAFFLPMFGACTASDGTERPQPTATEVAAASNKVDCEWKPAVADTILCNAEVFTMDESRPWAQAVAIRDGRILYVGDDAGVDAFLGSGTKVIDLGGRMVMPGFHDVHMHPLEAGSLVGGTCQLDGESDPHDFLDTFAQCGPQQIGTPWVLGFGFSIITLLEAETAPRLILDEGLGDTPAAMMEETSHSVWVNTAALRALGIERGTPDPPGGIIARDPRTGEPNGLLIDNAGDLAFEKAFAPTDELMQLHYEGLLFSLDRLARNGITSFCDARTYWTRGFHEVYRRAEREGTLTARAVLGLWAYPQKEDAEQLRTLKSMYDNKPNRLVRLSQIKVYSDGIVHNGTAALLAPYRNSPNLAGPTGLNYFDEERLATYITELERVGFDFHIHAIGDRGVREALNAIETARGRNGDRYRRRHRLTHVEMVDPADRHRFAQLDVIADFQVAGSFTDPSHRDESAWFIGSRARDFVPVRSIWDTGATVTLSSDWDVSDLNPFVGIQRSLFREHQSLPDLATALRCYTLNAAYAMGQEKETGSLVVGKYADLIVLDRNVFQVEPETIGRTRVLVTMLGGRTVFRDPSATFF
ncbi:Amidohydrolase [Sulfidibacter corallicola]|uniref:Amidohydrolase n=1 Tax=Sulfidibacter corallicola TaxID=2818388 RepID=A0A8A4TDM3_SULCO|nr:amidohydrolase [Sulfidibacter corallicola]QTD48026.1 amidohydrolase [Sulfidibacter corallicola]